jgi:hypothetical protein
MGNFDMEYLESRPIKQEPWINDEQELQFF